jgi:glycosyltransferase involved in cell wall biosynthesis
MSLRNAFEISSDLTLVSIVMNCYNGDKYLREAIDSIYAQSFDNWEIIFWDNGSTDSSASIAKSYDERLKYFFVENTTSLGKARNLALKEANGDYVAFLDCDDLYLPDKISIQLTAMQTKNALLSYGSWIKINEESEVVKKYKLVAGFDNKFEELYSKYLVNFQTLMIENNYLKENNITFDEKLKFSTDHNLVLRIAYNIPVMSIEKTLAKYRIHDDALSKNRKVDKYEDMEYTRRFFESIGAQKKFKNFRYFSLKAVIFMHLRDAFYDNNYKEVLFNLLDYLSLLVKKCFKRLDINNNY